MSNYSGRLVENQPSIKVITPVETNAIDEVRLAAFVGAFMGFFFFFNSIGERVLTGG